MLFLLPLVLLWGCSTAEDPLDGSADEQHDLVFTEVGTSLGTSDLVDMAFLPGTSNQSIVISKSGLVFYLKSDFEPLSEVERIPVAVTDEQGLLGLAVDPDYESNRHIYLFRTESVGGGNRVLRYTVTASVTGDSFGLGDEQVILDLPKSASPSPGTNNNGGGLVFDGAGNLYVGVGDGGGSSSSDVDLALAQSLGLRLGKILRIVPNRTVGAGGYTLPSAGNGFGGGALPEIWAAGLRNPFRLVWGDGRLFVSDPAVAYEEIDSAVAGGINFGWPLLDGPSASSSYADPLHGRSALDTSFADADPDENPSGGEIRVLLWYENSNYDALIQNQLLYGDGPAGWFRSLSLGSSGSLSTDHHRGHQLGLSRLAVATDGRIYGVALHHSTRILRVDLP